jgi:pyrimidine-nucleoside phosphorylase
MIYIRDLIKKKRNNEELTEEEMEFFISSYNKDEILKEQAAALLAMMNVRGLSEKEMAYFAKAVSESGKQIEIYEISNKLVDIHPIGGMDDKIIIMLMAILDAMGLSTIKTVGREIGVKDKLPNMMVRDITENNKSEIKQLVNEGVPILVREPENLAPVENKLYKLRNDIACNDDISIIAVNLISQELALGFKNVVFDISYGDKAYVKTVNDAKKLAKYLIKIGNNENVGINVKCVITKLNEPLGNSFGTSLETREALRGLEGEMAKDVKELLLEIGNKVLALQTKDSDKNFNTKKIMSAIESKIAYNKLLALTDNKVVNTTLKKSFPVMADFSGYVDEIDVSAIRTTAQYLNAIRHSEKLELEYGVGIEISKKVGDKVEMGDIIGYIYTDDETKVQKSVSNLKSAFKVVDRKVSNKSRIAVSL